MSIVSASGKCWGLVPPGADLSVVVAFAGIVVAVVEIGVAAVVAFGSGGLGGSSHSVMTKGRLIEGFDSSSDLVMAMQHGSIGSAFD